MTSHETFYIASTPTSSSHPASPASFDPPPPPPPKPPGHKQTPSLSTDPTGSGTPTFSSVSHPTFANPTVPSSTSSPRPLPPIPQAQNNTATQTPPPQQPQLQYQPQPPLPHTPSFTGISTPQGGQNQPPNSLPNSQRHQHIPPPALESHWLPAELLSLPTSELTPLLADAPLLAALATQHPSYASSQEPMKAAITANVALARQVAQTESQLTQLRDQTAQLLLNHTSLQTQWRRKQSEMDDALSPWGPRAMYQRLVSSINEQESLLKAMRESFLEGGVGNDAYHGDSGTKASDKEVMEWVRRIREGTTTLEKRREMRARWDEGRVGGWR